jgi:adenosylhomocysteine nucleosidase
MRDIAIFAALQWECRPILRALPGIRRGELGGLHVWRTGAGATRVTVIKTGIGLARAEAAARSAGAAQKFDLFLSSGCAGALADHLEPGDLVVADSVHTPERPSLAVHVGTREDALAAAARAAVRLHRGPILSSATMLASAAQKREASRHGFIAVEMEGAAIGQVAAEGDIPFASVRSILDRSDTTLEHGGAFVDPATGSVRPGALAAHLIRHPTAIGGLLAVKKMMDASEASLALFFREFLRS